MNCMKKFIGLAIILALAGGVMIASPCDAQTELRVYTHNETAEMEKWVPIAEKAIGMKIVWSPRLASNELWTRVLTEHPNFNADVIWGFLNSDAQVGTQRGFFVPYSSPAWADIPAEFKDPDHHWYGYNYWFSAIAVNPDLLKKKNLPKPKSWADLTNPVYKGEIVMPDPATSGTAFIFVSAVMQIFGEEKGWEILEKIHANAGQYTKSGSAPAQSVAQGEYAIGVSWDQAVYGRVQQKFPIEGLIPAEGTAFDLESVAILKGTKNLAGAQKLVDWLGTKEGQTQIGLLRSKVTRPGVPGKVLVDPKLIKYDALWAGENKKRIMSEWAKRFHK